VGCGACLSGLLPRLCRRVRVWLYVPSGFFPMEVDSPPPDNILFVGPAVRLGSAPPYSSSKRGVVGAQGLGFGV
jgi:hypothetical protein